MGLSVWHVLIVLVVVLILFGAGKLPQVMGDFAKGIKNFKAGLADEDDKKDTSADAAASVAHQSSATVPPPANTDRTTTTEKTAAGGKS
jgi:sec-independent protein translocase protein TatA